MHHLPQIFNFFCQRALARAERELAREKRAEAERARDEVPDSKEAPEPAHTDNDAFVTDEDASFDDDTNTVFQARRKQAEEQTMAIKAEEAKKQR